MSNNWAGRLRNFCQGDRENHAVHKLRVCDSFFYYQISGSDDETDVGLVETRTLGVRRLASEGCRPRLPWAMALPNLKENPAPIIPILENLKNDPARFVRLSVANNLNDIAKDNPEIVIDLVKKWKGESKEVDWIIKHGCRTLLKQGNPEVMELFGFNSTISNICVEDSKFQARK